MVYITIDPKGNVQAFGSIVALCDNMQLSKDTVYQAFSREKKTDHTMKNGLRIIKTQLIRKKHNFL